MADQISNGDAGSSVRATINTGLTNIETNQTNISNHFEALAISLKRYNSNYNLFAVTGVTGYNPDSPAQYDVIEFSADATYTNILDSDSNALEITDHTTQIAVYNGSAWAIEKVTNKNYFKLLPDWYIGDQDNLDQNSYVKSVFKAVKDIWFTYDTKPSWWDDRTPRFRAVNEVNSSYNIVFRIFFAEGDEAYDDDYSFDLAPDLFSGGFEIISKKITLNDEAFYVYMAVNTDLLEGESDDDYLTVFTSVEGNAYLMFINKKENSVYSVINEKLTKSTVDSLNLINYKDIEWGYTYSDNNAKTENNLYGFLKLYVKPGVTYNRYYGYSSPALSTWGSLNMRVFDDNNTSSYLQKTIENTITIDESAVNPYIYLIFPKLGMFSTSIDYRYCMFCEDGTDISSFIDGSEVTNTDDSLNFIKYNDLNRINNNDKNYDNFKVNVDINISDTSSETDDTQDGSSYELDNCILELPPNYNKDGEPITLVIAGYGSGTAITSTTQGVYNIAIPRTYLLGEGFAILSCNGTPGNEGGSVNHAGTPQAYRSYLAAYNYVIRNYNIRKEVVLVGYSMGTLIVNQIEAFGHIPVLTTVCFGFDLELWKQQYTIKSATVREYMCENFGFEGTAPTFTSDNPPTADEQTYILDNIEKWRPYNPFIRNIICDSIEDLYDVWLASSILPDGTDESTELAIYTDLKLIRKTPIKIFISENDTTNSPRFANYYSKMVRNAGGYAEVRTFPEQTSPHSYSSVGNSLTVSTPFKGDLTVYTPHFEAMMFIKRFVARGYQV